MTISKTKQEYIDAWNEHADSFYRLAFCSDENLSQQVTECINKLKELIPKIAETKTSFRSD